MRISLISKALIFLAATTFAQDVPSLLKSKGCFSCHDIEKEKIGPPYRIVAKEYRGKPDAVKTLVRSITGGSVGKWQGLASKYGIRIGAFYMPRQPVSKEEAEKIVKWILNLEK